MQFEIGNNLTMDGLVPRWVPSTARHYLDHIERGIPIREIARKMGAHASTISR